MLLLMGGILLGNLVGVLPGLGPAAGTALLLPMTFFLPPTTAIIFLAGIYYGAMYGGSTSSVLLNIPGEPSSVMTAYEGYKLTQRGRGGAALAMSAIASFFAGTLAVVGVMYLSVPLANLGLGFGPAENFALIVMAFTLVGTLSGASPARGLAMAALGMCLATVGQTTIVAGTRLTFGISALDEGFSIVAAAIGLFAIPEVLEGIERPSRVALQKGRVRLRDLVPSRQDWSDSATALPSGALVGFIGGVLPGAGATVSSFLAYGLQKRISRKPEQFGKGSMEAVAAVEGANNAASTGALIPMLSLGLPGSATTAILLGAMVLHGVQPGPLLIAMHPEIFWGLVASMYLGNIALLILNLPLIGIWISMLRLPQNIIITAVLAISVLGVYAEENSFSSIYVMIGFGALGWAMKKLNFPAPPLILALILTSQMETQMMRALALGHGNWTIFVSSPASVTLLTIAALSIALQLGLGGKVRTVSRRIWGSVRSSA
jgi:putative tricarboxylic transport membrane protein